MKDETREAAFRTANEMLAGLQGDDAHDPDTYLRNGMLGVPEDERGEFLAAVANIATGLHVATLRAFDKAIALAEAAAANAANAAEGDDDARD